MDGFEVTTGALREAAAAGEAVAGDAAALGLAEAAAAAGDALPGGAAGVAAAVLAGSWRVRVAATSEAVAQHAAALRRVADAYGGAERAAVAALAGER